MLTCTSFCDDLCLAKTLGKEYLTDSIVNFVRPSMVEIFCAILTAAASASTIGWHDPASNLAQDSPACDSAHPPRELWERIRRASRCKALQGADLDFSDLLVGVICFGGVEVTDTDYQCPVQHRFSYSNPDIFALALVAFGSALFILDKHQSRLNLAQGLEPSSRYPRQPKPSQPHRVTHALYIPQVNRPNRCRT